MTGNRLRSLFEPGALSCSFQPIVRAEKSSEVYGVEAIIRGPRGTAFEAPNVLFDYVRRKRAEAPIERECIRLVLSAVRELPSWVAITMNVHAATLARDSDFAPSLMRTCGINGIEPSRIVIEVVEPGAVSRQGVFPRAVDALRAVGVRIALDDFGGGSASYRTVLDTRPDFLKIDPYICRGVARDARRVGVIKSVVEMANDLGTATVGLGIEGSDDHHVLRDLGVAYLQGPLFALPLPVDVASIVLAGSATVTRMNAAI